MATSHSRQSASLLPTFLAIFSLLLLLLSAVTASEVGYGPGFDSCGDNCQTQMVAFCTIGHSVLQMQTCWCDDSEYINRMDTCLDSCDPAVSSKAQQRDQMLRYRRFVCEPVAASKDTQFAEYYRTKFASISGGFVPGVTRGVPPPTTSPRLILTVSTADSDNAGYGYASPRPSSAFSTATKPTINTTATTLSTATATATASPYVTALPSIAAGPTLLRTGLTTLQLVSIIISVAIVSVLLSLAVVYYIRRRNPRRPIWDPPPPPPLPRPSPVSLLLPYHHPTSPPPTVLSYNTQDLEPHAITTSTTSIYSSRDSNSVVSPSRERGRYNYFPRESPVPSPGQSEFQKYLQPPKPASTASTASTARMARTLTPVISPTQSSIQITSASAIAAATAAAEAAERSNRASTHTVIELEPQQVIVQGIAVGHGRRRNRSRSRSGSRPRGSGRKSRRDTTGEDSECCGDDYCTASCSSWSERSLNEEDDNWWDLRESQVMEPSI